MDKKRNTLRAAKLAFARHLHAGEYVAARRVVIRSLLPSAPDYLPELEARRAFGDFVATLTSASTRRTLAHRKIDPVAPAKPARLSLTVVMSALQRLSDAHSEGASRDAGFDGGEFSGPAHARQHRREALALITGSGWTVRELQDALDTRLSSKAAYELGHLVPDEEAP